VRIGSNLIIYGGGFTRGSMANFFVATAKGAINAGPLKPSTSLPDQLVVPLAAGITQGEGFVTLQVVNVDQGYATSNSFGALLEGSAAAGLPSITGINNTPIAADSIDPHVALANVHTVIPLGIPFPIAGDGFDVIHGVAVDIFCDCTGGKVGPFFLNAGNVGLSATRLLLSLPLDPPAAPAIGPGAVRVSNKGSDGRYSRSSAAVSAPLGARITLSKVTQAGAIINVSGTGFASATVINFFNTQRSAVVNLGGLNADGSSRIPLTFIDSTHFAFAVPLSAVPGPSYVQAINPPFVFFASSGNGPGGVLTLK